MRLSIVLLMVMAACADPTLPGTYRGVASGQQYPPTWTLSLDVATGDGVTTVGGTWSVVGIMIDAGGTVTGSFEDPDLTLSLASASSANCGYDFLATWHGDSITGTYTAVQCFVTAVGDPDLDKQ